VDDGLDERLIASASWENPQALVELGCDLADADRPADAEHCFRRALELGASWVWLNLGHALTSQHRLEEAATAYRQAADVGEADAWLNLGLVLEELGDLDGAERAYRRADDLGDSEGTLALAFLLRERGEYAAAKQLARRAAASGSSQAAGVVVSWQWNETLDPAIEPALRVGAEHYPPARADLADLLSATGRSGEARRVLERGAKLGEREAWLPLGNLYIDELGDHESAEAAYRSGIAAGDTHCHHNLGVVLAGRGDAEGALEQFRLGAVAGDQLAAAALRELLGKDR